MLVGRSSLRHRPQGLTTLATQADNKHARQSVDGQALANCASFLGLEQTNTSGLLPFEAMNASLTQSSGLAGPRSARSHRRSPLACRSASGQSTTKGTQVKLGKTGLQIAPLGAGTLAWGDPGNGFNKTYRKDDLTSAFEALSSGGINFFDTAEVYGYQGIGSGCQSEQLLGQLVKQHRATPGGAPLVVATKFFTVPWTNLLVGGGLRIGRQSMIKALRASLQRLGLDKVDLWQIHFPLPIWPQGTLADGLQEAIDLGLTSAVGVCNYNTSQMEEIHGLLASKNIPLASNQVKYSLTDRSPEMSGLLAKCKELDVTLIAHSPLAQGLLTDKNVGSGDKYSSVLKLMQFIGTVYGGASVTQVALNYLRAKGAVPIPGCKSKKQAEDLAAALNWELEENEVAMLDEKLDSLQ
ncbi:hypothetical protein WJX74_007404 [Apatococcus lobatus]|uniref:NADP-dependent oxidoreductase domain-containing protein n=1 Tax=Apatococcus lobatus TaxID=904363 RepID=A0AAW1QAN5_9CHLO